MTSKFACLLRKTMRTSSLFLKRTCNTTKPTIYGCSPIAKVKHVMIFFSIAYFVLIRPISIMMLKVAILALALGLCHGQVTWWEHTIIYQVYPRSFQDSNGDGVGDLKGIESRLDHFNYLGVETIWMSPIFESPMKDFGYDVSNFTNVDPLFGTLQDFDDLVAAAHSRGKFSD